jgi:hypothetical protein
VTIHDVSSAADPALRAVALMRATWPERADDPVAERLRLVHDLSATDQDDTDLLATWLRRAIQD